MGGIYRVAQALGDDVVDSYGVCAHNRDWPEGFKKDKEHVMRNHKFCIAMENNVDYDYVTEKVRKRAGVCQSCPLAVANTHVHSCGTA